MERRELPKRDLNEYVGTKTLVEKSEVIETKFGLALRLESMNFSKEDENPLSASALFSFAVDKETGVYYIGEETKLDRFCSKKNIKIEEIPEDISKGMELPQFIGVPVVVQMNANTGYLELI